MKAVQSREMASSKCRTEWGDEMKARMSIKQLLSAMIVAALLVSVLSTATAVAGHEPAEGAYDGELPSSSAPSSGSSAEGELSIRVTTNGDTLCEDVDIVFVIDCSGSMSISDAEVEGTTVTRLTAAKAAATAFIDQLPTGTSTRVAVVSFESYGYAAIEQALTTDFRVARAAIAGLSVRGAYAMTSIGEGFAKARQELTDHGGANKRVVLLLTDGLANEYPPGWSPPAGWISPPGSWAAAEQYAFVQAHAVMTLDAGNPTRVYTVGMGKQSDINEGFLEVLAHSSAGEYFFAGTTLVSQMFAEVRADICLGDITTLILVNFPRMSELGYFSLLNGSPIVPQLSSALDDLANANPNGRGVVVDLGYLGNEAIDTAYDNWDGHEGDVARTNALVDAIDEYIEGLKQDESDGYPLLRYVVIVGAHEVIPMQARPDDYAFRIEPDDGSPAWYLHERHWTGGLPQASGYVYDIYRAGTNGHYLTDTPYSDLSYRDSAADHELTPEIAVSRIVETPQQIIGVIDAYMDNSGKIPSDHFVSMASSDYVDGGTQASDYMNATGVPTDDSLVDCLYDSTDIPPLLNAQHDLVYLAGHGEYNWITTGSGDGFMAGNHSTHGSTDDLNPIDGAVIVTSGCHNGVSFGNMLYHAPDAGTTYHEFPEDFAAAGTVAYVGATGYTVISGTGCGTTVSWTGYNERLATNVVYYLTNGVDVGQAFRNAARDYFRAASPLTDVHRRVLAIATLYGIPTYKDPVNSPESPPVTPELGVKVQKSDSGQVRASQEAPEQVIVTVSDYTVESTGIVEIPGMTQVLSPDTPILPKLFVGQTLPRGSAVGFEWNPKDSESVVIRNDVPIAGFACREGSFPGSFEYEGFWPPEPFGDYRLLTFGSGGHEVGLVVRPVQYNPTTGETRIWTKLVFDVFPNIPDTGISVRELTTDKEEYGSDEDAELLLQIYNSGYTRLVNLHVMMRDLNTGEELASQELGLMGLEGGATEKAYYTIRLAEILGHVIEGRTLEAELIASDPHNGDVLATRSVSFDVLPGLPEGVYLRPSDSSSLFCTTTEVEIWVNAPDFQGGQMKLRYNPDCADVTDWQRNKDVFLYGTWDSSTPGEEWILFSAEGLVSGNHLIGTLTVHCVSEEACTGALTFVEPSALKDNFGNDVPVSWNDGTFACEVGTCGDVAPAAACDGVVNVKDPTLLLNYVGYPGDYSLCCEACGDVSPSAGCDGVIDVGDFILLLNYVVHPGKYRLCCETGAAASTSPPPAEAPVRTWAATQGEVTFVPQESSAPYNQSTEVEIWADASDFQSGQIKFTYDTTCADVIGWERNTEDFLYGGWDSDTAGEEWIVFIAEAPLSGEHLVGTLTVQCVSDEDCTTTLDFVEPSLLSDDLGNDVPATWVDGTFRKGAYEVFLPLIMREP